MKVKIKILAPLLVVFLTIFVWYKVLNQQFLGEGYTFFSRNTIEVRHSFFLGAISRMDVFARVLFIVGGKIFKDNISVYMYLMMLIMVAINLLFYYLVFTLTGRALVALTASIFFVANYATSYEIYSLGFYQIFVGRLPNFVPAFLSLIILAKYFKTNHNFLYFFSVALYLLAMMMSHFTIYFLPIYLIFIWPLYFAKNKVNLQNLAKMLLRVLPFVVISFMALILEKNFDPETLTQGKISLRYFVQSLTLVTTVAYQLVLVSLPRRVLQLFTEPQIRDEVLTLFWPLFTFYLAATFYLFRRDKKLAKSAFCSLLFVLASLFFNSYTREEIVHTVGETSRYFYVPFIGMAVYWAILLYVFLYQKKNLILKVLFLTIICWWINDNRKIIWKKMDQNQKYHDGVRLSLDYFKKNSPNYPSNSFIVLPHELGYYGASFCNRFYNSASFTLEPIFASWEESEFFSLDRLIVLDFDYQTKQVVDKTNIFRQLFQRRKKIGEDEFRKELRAQKVAEMEKSNLIK